MITNESKLSEFVFVNEPSEEEIIVVAKNSKEAYKMAWASLSEEEKDTCSYLDLVDIIEIKE